MAEVHNPHRALQMREIAEHNAEIDQANHRLWVAGWVRDYHIRERDKIVRDVEREDAVSLPSDG
jgi:hypothetical protein